MTKKHYIVIEGLKDLTLQKLQDMLQKAYEDGYTDGQNSMISITYGSNSNNSYGVYCDGSSVIKAPDVDKVSIKLTN